MGLVPWGFRILRSLPRWPVQSLLTHPHAKRPLVPLSKAPDLHTAFLFLFPLIKVSPCAPGALRDLPKRAQSQGCKATFHPCARGRNTHSKGGHTSRSGVGGSLASGMGERRTHGARPPRGSGPRRRRTCTTASAKGRSDPYFARAGLRGPTGKSQGRSSLFFRKVSVPLPHSLPEYPEARFHSKPTKSEESHPKRNKSKNQDRSRGKRAVLEHGPGKERDQGQQLKCKVISKSHWGPGVS